MDWSTKEEFPDHSQHQEGNLNIHSLSDIQFSRKFFVLQKLVQFDVNNEDADDDAQLRRQVIDYVQII